MAVLELNEFADKLFIQELRGWELVYQQEVQNTGAGEILSSDIGAALRQGEVVLPPRANEESAELEAIIEMLAGANNAFYLFDPRKQYPAFDPTGSILAGSTVRINSVDIPNVTMQLKDLPANYQLTVGDYLAFDYGTPARRALHRVASNVTADGAGTTGDFTVTPAIRAGAAENDVVMLIKPAAKCVMVPQSLRVASTSSLTSQISFAVRQTLRAD